MRSRVLELGVVLRILMWKVRVVVILSKKLEFFFGVVILEMFIRYLSIVREVGLN